MLAQERQHGGAPEPLGGGGRRREPHKGPEPGLVGGRTKGEQLRIEAMKLLAQPIGEAPPLFA